MSDDERKDPTAEGEEELNLDFGKKKKKASKKKKDQKDGEEGGAGEGAAQEESNVDGSGKPFVKGAVYPYEQLLARIQEILNERNPDIGQKKKFTLKPPQVVRVGAKKVGWVNFKELCAMMNRSPEHMFQFVLAELGTEGSVAGDDQLVLKGRYGTKHIESLLRKYIREYVTCKMCSSPNTQLERDHSTRLYKIMCGACGADRTVQAIKAGFHATSRADRKKAKQAA